MCEIGSPTWIAFGHAVWLRLMRCAFAQCIRTTTFRLTGGHAPLTSSGNRIGASGRSCGSCRCAFSAPRLYGMRYRAWRCTCIIPFRRRVPGLFGHRSNGMNENGHVPRCCPGRLLVPSEAGSLAPSHAILSGENGGLCGHCSRDLPLDRRLLFVAELTGQ